VTAWVTWVIRRRLRRPKSGRGTDGDPELDVEVDERSRRPVGG